MERLKWNSHILLSRMYTDSDVYDEDGYNIYYEIQDRKETKEACYRIYIMGRLYDEICNFDHRDFDTVEEAKQLAELHYKLWNAFNMYSFEGIGKMNTIIWTPEKDYFLGTHQLQEFVIRVDTKKEIEHFPEKPLVTREIVTTQYVLYLKNGNECVKLCAKNTLYDAKLIAKKCLEKIDANMEV